ncbi:hypothetical protein TNCV_1859381 [Trichonephila clavipes]|nr:hypothetical protein TNCV_1859381 [Trichonephila clavipes]
MATGSSLTQNYSRSQKVGLADSGERVSPTEGIPQLVKLGGHFRLLPYVRDAYSQTLDSLNDSSHHLHVVSFTDVSRSGQPSFILLGYMYGTLYIRKRIFGDILSYVKSAS